MNTKTMYCQQISLHSVVFNFNYLGKKTIVILLGIFFLLTKEVFSQNLSMSGGNGHSIMLCGSGAVYTMGLNGNGQLGTNGVPGFSITPIQVLRGAQPSDPLVNDGTHLGGIRQVDAGSGAHNVALACNGAVWSWGWNSQGQVGDNTLVDKTLPVQVLTGAQGDASGFLRNVTQVTAGNETSFALMSDGRVMSWGRNVKGELGDGTNVQKSTPVYVKTGLATFLTNIIQIEGGDATGAALKADGTVWMWGFNGNGQLGQNNTTDLTFATQVFIDAAKTQPLTGIVSLSLGDTHILALAADGTVWTWGGNWAGQLGVNNGGANCTLPKKVQLTSAGPDLSGVSAVSAGNRHSMAVMNDGTLMTWGAVGGGVTYLGQTGTGAGSSYPATVPGLTNIVEASDGDNWTFAVNSSGTIYAFGENTTNGYLGVNSTAATIPTPTAITLPCALLKPCVDAFLSSDVVLCSPASATLYGPSGATTVKYRWKRNGVLLPDTTSSLFVNVAGTYRLIMWDSSYTNGCGYCPPDSDEAVVTNSSPVQANNAGFCPNPCSSVNLSVTGAGGSNYDWYTAEFGGTLLNGAPSNTYTTPCLTTSTTYWVQDRSTQRCSAGYSYNVAPLSSSASATSTNDATKMVFDVLTSFTLDTITVAYNKINYGVCGGGAASTSNLFSVVVKNSSGTTLATATPTVACGSGVATIKIPVGYTFPVGAGYRLEFVAGPSAHSYVYFQNGANYTTVPECSWINFVGSPTADTDDWPPFYNWSLRVGSNACGRTPVTAFDNCILPVEYLSFIAVAENEKVNLYWSVSEINNSHFSIQRSSNGKDFETIGRVKGAGTISYANYIFVDENPLPGISYYRIQQVDLDGNFSYSEIRSVSIGTVTVTLFPNPFSDHFTLTVASDVSREYGLVVTDLTGKLFYEGTYNTNDHVDLGKELASGMYLVKVTLNDQSFVLKANKY